MVPAGLAVDAVVAVLALTVLAPAAAVGYLMTRATRLPAKLGVLAGPFGADRRSALLPAALFLAGFGWLSLEGAVPSDPGLVDTLLFGLALGGAVGMAVGIGNLGRYRALAGGRALGGPAEPAADGAVPTPFGGERAVAWAVRVRERPRFFGRGPWPPIHAETGGAACVVRGDTRQVRIDPASADLDLWPRASDGAVDSWWIDPDGHDRDERLPERVVAFARDRGLSAPARKRVYEEISVPPGARVTVIDPPGGPDATPTVVRGSLETVRARTRRRVYAGVVGLGCLVVGVLALGVRGGAIGP